MQQTKKGRVAARLVFFLAAAMLVTMLPAAMVRAATRVSWYNGGTETEIAVEAGAKFYLGDYIRIYSDTAVSTAALGKASYRSQNKKAAAINGKGYLSAKKAGTTDITVTCQGKTLTCHLTVEKKNTFEQTRSVKELKAAAKTLAKGLPKKLNASKGYSLNQKRNRYMEVYNGTAKELSYDGFLYEGKRSSKEKADYGRSARLAVPEAGRFLTADALLRQFQVANNPVSASSKKTMQAASFSASSKTGKFIVKLKKKLDADQILAAQLAFPKQNITEGRTKANITITVYDETANRYYKGKPVLRKGSRQLEFQPLSGVSGMGDPVKIEKGHVYMLGSEWDWSDGIKTTAK